MAKGNDPYGQDGNGKPRKRSQVGSWTSEELKLLDLILRMIELDPPLAKVEATLERSLDLVRRVRDHWDVTE